MLKKQIYIGQLRGTKLYIHISLILSTILAWSVVTLITKPALGFSYGLFLYGSTALIAATVTLMAKVGYEIGRLMLLQNHGMTLDKLVLLPLSGLLLYDEENHSRRSIGFWASFMPILPLIALISVFSAITLSPTASEFQISVLRGIALVLIFFTAARLMGAFAVDRLNTVHGLIWRLTDNLKVADFIYEVWRNFSIAGILGAAVVVSPTYRWLGIALAISIAWGLYDAVLYQREHEQRFKIEKIKSHFRRTKISNQRLQNFSKDGVLN